MYCYTCKQNKPNSDFSKYWVGRRKTGKGRCTVCSALQQKQWASKNQEYVRFNARTKQNRVTRLTHEYRERALLVVGGGQITCSACGFNDARAIDINHKNGNGNKERVLLSKGSKGSMMFYRKICSGKRNTDDLNLLCRNCNWIDWIERQRSQRTNPQVLVIDMLPPKTDIPA